MEEVPAAEAVVEGEVFVVVAVEAVVEEEVFVVVAAEAAAFARGARLRE